MMKNKGKRRYSKSVKWICLALACLTAVFGGCGQKQEEMQPESVELLNPAGVAISYETAARRNLYGANVYFALVCPYVEEYGLRDTGAFEAYDALPGDAVTRGSTLIHYDTEDITERIENMEESIADMEESYQEFLAENEEKLTDARNSQQILIGILDTLEQKKPEEFIADPEDPEGEQIYNPDYDEWYNGRWGYKWAENSLRDANQSVAELEVAIKERKELYALDHAYNQLLLKRLKDDRSRATLVSGMDGYVAGIRFMTEGNWISGNLPLMAVCDTARPEIRCEYISASDIKNAADVYAFVNGKRYEVEYEEIDTKEYQRLQNQNGAVYSTFHVVSGAGELEVGSYAVIVVKNQVRENVVTVPSDAIKQEGSIRYVYLADGSENVYTVVTTGMTDGTYTEILSGVQEGDKVLTEQAVTAGDDTVTVQRGSVEASFSEMGYLYYPSTEMIVNPVKYGTCYYEGREVNRYQRVEKGDLLARIRVVPDEAEIGRNEQKLVRQRERLEDLKKEGIEGNEKTIEQMEEAIRELEELIADMRADAAITEIRAPRSGIIIDVYESYTIYFNEGDILSSGERLFELADERTGYVYVEDPNGQLTYGNVTTVSYTDLDGNKNEITADVVSLNRMSLSGGLVSDPNIALIRIPPENIGAIAGSRESWNGFYSRSSFQVKATIRKMDNVLLVPRSAVTERLGRTYVKVRLESGEIQYRSFIAGGSDINNYWVVEGLTEGMEICLK